MMSKLYKTFKLISYINVCESFILVKYKQDSVNLSTSLLHMPKYATGVTTMLKKDMHNCMIIVFKLRVRLHKITLDPKLHYKVQSNKFKHCSIFCLKIHIEHFFCLIVTSQI